MRRHTEQEAAQATASQELDNALAELNKAVEAREHSTKSMAKAAQDTAGLAADKATLEDKVGRCRPSGRNRDVLRSLPH